MEDTSTTVRVLWVPWRQRYIFHDDGVEVEVPTEVADRWRVVFGEFEEAQDAITRAVDARQDPVP